MDPGNIFCTDGANRTEAMIGNLTGAIPKVKESSVHDLQTASDNQNKQDKIVAEVQNGIKEIQRKEQETRERMAEMSEQLSELEDDTCSFAEAEYEDDNCSDCTDDDFMSDILDEEDIELEFIDRGDESNKKAVKRLVEEMKECSRVADILYQALAQRRALGKGHSCNMQNPETLSKTDIATQIQLAESKTTEQLTKKELKKIQRETKKKEKQEKKRQKKEAKLQKKERKQMEKQRKTANRKNRYIYQEADEDAHEHTKPRGLGDRVRSFLGCLFCFST